jgi:predicted RNA-binding protein with TRAM domain
MRNLTTTNLVVKNDLHSYDIEVIGSSDANFDAEVAAFTGNYDGIRPLVETAKPFTVFVKNTSKKEVVGICLRWQFVKNDGEFNEFNQIETSPGVLMGMKPRDPFMKGKTSLINSNSHRFFSKFQSIQTELLNAFKSNRSKRFVYELNPNLAKQFISETESQKQMMLKDVSNVSVTIDSIIFNDGTVVGENQSFLFEILDGLVQAKRDFLKKLRIGKQAKKNSTDNLNDFILERKFIVAENKLNTNFSNGEDAFNQTYRYQMDSFLKEIKNKRAKASDNYIVQDFLTVKDSEFIQLKRK